MRRQANSGVYGEVSLINNEALPLIEKFSQLKALELHGSRVDSDGLKRVAEMESLVYLGLPYDASDSDLATVGKMKNLIALNLYRCMDISDAGMQGMDNLENLRCLESNKGDGSLC